MYACKEYPSQENNYRISSYNQRLANLSMCSLKNRRVISNITFMYDILHGHANCPSLKEIVTLNVNDRGLRRRELLKINDKDMKLALACPLAQMVKFANVVKDIFLTTDTRSGFLSALRATDDSIFSSTLQLR